jgi:hypothetical protein
MKQCSVIKYATSIQLTFLIKKNFRGQTMYIFHHIFCCVVISGVVIKLLKIERIGMKKLATKFYVVRQGGVFFCI